KVLVHEEEQLLEPRTRQLANVPGRAGDPQRNAQGRRRDAAVKVELRHHVGRDGEAMLARRRATRNPYVRPDDRGDNAPAKDVFAGKAGVEVVQVEHVTYTYRVLAARRLQPRSLRCSSPPSTHEAMRP